MRRWFVNQATRVTARDLEDARKEMIDEWVETMARRCASTFVEAQRQRSERSDRETENESGFQNASDVIGKVDWILLGRVGEWEIDAGSWMNADERRRVADHNAWVKEQAALPESLPSESVLAGPDWNTLRHQVKTEAADTRDRVILGRFSPKVSDADCRDLIRAKARAEIVDEFPPFVDDPEVIQMIRDAAVSMWRERHDAG